MATLRPPPSLFRLAAASLSQPTSAARPRLCLQCRLQLAQRKAFTSHHTLRQSSKRPLMTSTTQQPHSPPMEPPPARNEGVPETSITSSDQTWPPTAPWERLNSSKNSSSSISTSQPTRESELEAQKSKPTASTLETPKKKPKLRPRKAPITLTPAAVSALHTLFESPDGGKYIRVGVKNRGCSGLAYHLEYVDKAGNFDETVEQDGVKVLIDSKALFSIIGSEMDWVQDKLQERFVFRNPNITEQCGCGESFSVSQ